MFADTAMSREDASPPRRRGASTLLAPRPPLLANSGGAQHQEPMEVGRCKFDEFLSSEQPLQ